jgi:hypothetical protein
MAKNGPRAFRSLVSTKGAALAAYLVVSFVYFGVPVAAHPGRDLLGTGPDPEIFVWSFAWWPHAILHWENPIVTHAIWAPEGVNLAWVACAPGLALLAAPLTLAAGPAVAFNVVTIVLPALAAWTAFLLCRHLTRSFWPSLAGGYLFGFSSYELGHTGGHMHLTSVFLVPLVALVLLRFLDGSLSARRSTLFLGVLLALQYSFSTEVVFTLTFCIAVTLLVAFVIVPSVRGRFRKLALPLVGGYAIAGLLTAPLLAYALSHFESRSINPPSLYPADLLNVVVPTRITWASWHWTRAISDAFAGNSSENGAYIGLPSVAMLAWLGWARRRQPATRFLIILFALGVLAELGTALHIHGHRYVWLPWQALQGLRGFNNVLPARFSMYVALLVAVSTALWASTTAVPRWARVALPLIAIAFIVPRLWIGILHEHPARPSFFTSGTYRICLQPNENVVMLPFPYLGDSMLWQAEAGFRFRMANGFVSVLDPPDVPPTLGLEINNPSNRWQDAFQWAGEQGATMILVDGTRSSPWVKVLTPAGGLSEIGGVYLRSLMPDGRSSCTAGSG